MGKIVIYRFRNWIRKYVFSLFFHENDLMIDSSKSIPIRKSELRLIGKFIENAIENELEAWQNLIPLEQDKKWFSEWPGEHYRLLSSICKVFQPKLSIEIGTWRGLGALALSLHSEKVITYDILAITNIENSISNLLEVRPNVEQRIADLSVEEIYRSQLGYIKEADLIFVDGPKDSVFESRILPLLVRDMKPGSLMIIDDIRFKNMRRNWQNINKPKIDLADLGHISGTGIVFL